MSVSVKLSLEGAHNNLSTDERKSNGTRMP